MVLKMAAAGGRVITTTLKSHKILLNLPKPNNHNLHTFLRTQIATRFPHSPFYQILPPITTTTNHHHNNNNNNNNNNLPLLRSQSQHLNMSSQATSSPLPPPDSSSSTPIQTVRVMIKGRVQGVFYRDWTVENAKELGLKGWVRNRRDGSVEALFSGNPDKVGEMQERCRRGPPSAMVTGLDVNPSTEDPGTGFERRSTV